MVMQGVMRVAELLVRYWQLAGGPRAFLKIGSVVRSLFHTRHWKMKSVLRAGLVFYGLPVFKGFRHRDMFMRSVGVYNCSEQRCCDAGTKFLLSSGRHHHYHYDYESTLILGETYLQAACFRTYVIAEGKEIHSVSHLMCCEVSC